MAAAHLRFATEEDAALLQLMFIANHREVTDRVVGAADRSLGLGHDLTVLGHDLTVLGHDLIVQGQERGALEPGDPQHVTVVLFATLRASPRCSTATWRHRHCSMGVTTSVDQFTREPRHR